MPAECHQQAWRHIALGCCCSRRRVIALDDYYADQNTEANVLDTHVRRCRNNSQAGSPNVVAACGLRLLHDFRRAFVGVLFSLTYHRHMEDAWGTTGSSGTFVKFDWQAVRLCPDEALDGIVAHEMAHVHQFATGKDRDSLTNEDVKGLYGVIKERLSIIGRVELHADETMLKWGYKPLLFPTWVMQYDPKVKNSIVRLREKPLSKEWARRKAKWERWRNYQLL